MNVSFGRFENGPMLSRFEEWLQIDATGLRMLRFGHHLSFAAFTNIRSGVSDRLRTSPVEINQRVTQSCKRSWS